MLAVRPEHNERRQLSFEGYEPEGRWGLRDAGLWVPSRTPRGRRVFEIVSHEETLVTSLVPGDERFTSPQPMREALGCVDDSTAIVISSGGDQIERVDLVSGAREIVFPR